MARSSNQKSTVTTIVGDVFTDALDITSLNGASYQFIGGGTTTGSITLQKSNDGANFIDTSFTVALASGKGLVDSGSTLMTGFTRLKITIATNPGAATVYGLAKES